MERHFVHVGEGENQFSNTSYDKVHDPKVNTVTRASKRAGMGKELAVKENSKSPKVPQLQSGSMGNQDFQQMELCKVSQSHHIHGMLPSQLHNTVPATFHNTTSTTQFHNMHGNKIPR